MRRISVHSLEPTAAGTERQARDTRGRDASTGRGKPMALGGGIELAPVHSRLRPHHPCLRIDVDPLHRREVEHDPVVAYGVSVDTVTAALDGEGHACIAREEDAGDDASRTRAPHDGPRTAIDHRVEDGACLVVAVVTRLEEIALEAPADDRNRGLVEDRACHGPSLK